MSAPEQPVVHTPGPWEVRGPSQSGHCRRIFAGDEYVGIVGGSDQLMRTIRANADLVAAAPEMLEVLRKFMDFKDSEYVPNGLFERARIAIDGAIGEVV